MLRTVLRNVQYYLLFFSILLVLLAFQRLHFLDRGWISPRGDEDAAPSSIDAHVATDRTTMMRGGGGDGVVVHRDDYESSTRSIDLFKFRLGLFEFVLPSWSSSTSTAPGSRSIPILPLSTKTMIATSRRNDDMVSTKDERKGRDGIDGSVGVGVEKGVVGETSSTSRSEAQRGSLLPRLSDHSSIFDGLDKSPSVIETTKKEEDGIRIKTKDGSSEGEKTGSVVAYVVIAAFQGKAIDSSDDDGARSASAESRERRRQHDRHARAARALMRSIENAHVGSRYEYRPYAFNLANSSSSSAIRILSEAGFEVLNVNELDIPHEYDGGFIVADAEGEEMTKGGRGALRMLLDGHEIVVHLGGTNTIVVSPMDDIFDALTVVAGGIHENEAMGIVDDENDVEARKIDSFALASSSSVVASADDDDVGALYIFKSSSRRASDSYLEMLECIKSSRMRRRRWVDPSSSREDGTADNAEEKRHSPSLSSSLIRKDWHRLERHISKGGGGFLPKIVDCSAMLRAHGGGTRLLDPCLYDAGNAAVDDGGAYRDCSVVGKREDIRVARFPGKSADVVVLSGRDDTERGDNVACVHCGCPWEYPSEEGCSKAHVGRVDGEVCAYLCRKWFLLGM